MASCVPCSSLEDECTQFAAELTASATRLRPTPFACLLSRRIRARQLLRVRPARCLQCFGGNRAFFHARQSLREVEAAQLDAAEDRAVIGHPGFAVRFDASAFAELVECRVADLTFLLLATHRAPD